MTLRAFTELESVLEYMNDYSSSIEHTFKQNDFRYFVTFSQWLNDDATVSCYAFKLRKQKIGNPCTKKIGEVYGKFLYDEDGDSRRYKKEIWISDFTVSQPSNGFGSILMSHLITYAKKCGAKYISGKFSFVDEHNADRRQRFYEKHGFIISETGYIRKEL